MLVLLLQVCMHGSLRCRSGLLVLRLLLLLGRLLLLLASLAAVPLRLHVCAPTWQGLVLLLRSPSRCFCAPLLPLLLLPPLLLPAPCLLLLLLLAWLLVLALRLLLRALLRAHEGVQRPHVPRDARHHGAALGPAPVVAHAGDDAAGAQPAHEFAQLCKAAVLAVGDLRHSKVAERGAVVKRLRQGVHQPPAPHGSAVQAHACGPVSTAPCTSRRTLRLV